MCIYIYIYCSALMKGFTKSFTNKAIDNAIIKFPNLKINKQINNKRRKITDYHYCRSDPKVRNHPTLAGLSRKAIQLIGYQYQSVLDDQNTALYLSGSKLIEGSVPVCHNYCGFQFGVWAGQLGDGRAHTLGTVENEGKVYELQLKGSGQSPFSRHADGNSVVSSATRQFLASQLMAGLNIPTTRAASLVLAQQNVLRDPFYDGNTKIQHAAIVLRICPSFIRIGSFHVCDKLANMYTPDMLSNRQTLQPLAQYLHKTVYSHIDQEQCDVYQQMYKQVVERNARLVAYWQANGFVHGVLNTDNISMVGVTIDYGPFGFIDYFSKDYVSNATDTHQRYSYRQQPQIMKHNLLKLAQSYDYLVPKQILISYTQQNFPKIYKQTYNHLLSKKLGLQNNKESGALIQQLFDIMHICGSNFTNTFRILNQISSQNPDIKDIVQKLLNQSLPTQYYLKGLKAYPQFKNISPEQLQLDKAIESGFNPYFILEQKQRLAMQQQLKKQNCEQRTGRQRQLWMKWVTKYTECEIDIKIRQQNTVKYVLLNETAKLITEQLIALKPTQQQQLLDKILKVFEKPYQYDQWFEEHYWSRRPVPVRLTCSS